MANRPDPRDPVPHEQGKPSDIADTAYFLTSDAAQIS
jgi:hypothetical protein